MIDIKKGLSILKRYIDIAPEQAGVYRMIDEGGRVLYVGKAKNIKKRIVAYSHIEKLPLRLQKMVSEISIMEFVVVENETKALLLESDLIKKLEPKYNILLKDDKSFPYLMLEEGTDYPMLKKYRGVKKDGVKYFGPFANAMAVNYVLDILQKAFLLRSCSDTVFKNRTRPCLAYQIKRCSGACVGKISKDDYRLLVNEAMLFLEGKSSQMQQDLSEKMFAASQKNDFETAMVFRDRIKALTTIQQGKDAEYGDIKSADFVAVYVQNDHVAVEVFFIRGGQNCGNMAFFPKQAKDAEQEEVLEAFLSGFYTSHVPPAEIVVNLYPSNRDFLQEAIGVRINSYQRGNKAKILQNAEKNAQEALSRKIALETSIANNLSEMAEVFGLKTQPKRIEVYDNSHIQGAYSVGAFVVAGPQGFDKKSYRSFNIKNEEAFGDDFAMMKEVLSRRFDKMSDENRPDVILIDGGAGQLSAVYQALEGYDLSGITIIAIAKGVDRNAGKEVYHQLGKAPFSLPFASPLAFYMQNIRDEAHRFAIGAHRKKRAKSMTKSQLDGVDGVGVKRKKALLSHFGSWEAISQASIKDILLVGGISAKMAEKIFNYFHK